MSVLSLSRLRAVLVSVALVAIVSLGFSASASATGSKTFNNASVSITGGNANALAACVNYAKLKAKYGKAVQSNYCKNFAFAKGGNVNLKNVDIAILQSSSGTTTANNATVTISGGDATAVAACVNFLSGGATAYQKNKCANTAVAKGGNVRLKNVTITIIQE